MSDMVTIFNGPDRFPTTRSVMTVLKYRFRVRQLRNLQNELRVVAQTQCVLPVTYVYVLEQNLEVECNKGCNQIYFKFEK